MKTNNIKKSKILWICKAISLILIFLSLSEFYFESASILEQTKQWNVDLIEKGENVYRGYKTVWNNLSENEKERIRMSIESCENMMRLNVYFIIEDIYHLTLNIILFVSLFILGRWVKWYLIFWAFSDILIVPAYYSLIGFDPLVFERLATFTFSMKIAVIAIMLIIFTAYFFLGRHIFKLIDAKAKEQDVW